MGEAKNIYFTCLKKFIIKHNHQLHKNYPSYRAYNSNMEVEGPDAVDTIDEMPDAKRRKLSSETDMDLDAMKVKDLRDALEERGLDSKGVKAVLKERLMEALAKENAEDAEEPVNDAKTEAPPVADLNGHAEDDASMDA